MQGSGKSANPWTFGTREMVLAAIFGAMVIALKIVPGLGSIPVPNLSGAMTTLLVPVILGAIIGGPIVGMIAGLVMGILYLIDPTTAAFGPITLVVPRPVFALVAWFLYRSLKGTSVAVAASVAGALGAVVNTLTAVGIAVILGQVGIEFFAVVAPQAMIEMVICAILIPIIVVAVDAAMKARR